MITAPSLHRAPMRAVPWFGFWRSMAIRALRIGRGTPAGAASGLDLDRGWERAATRRRRVLLASLALLAIGSGWLAQASGVASGTVLLLGTLLLAWIGIGFVTAAMGAWVRLRGDPHVLQVPAGERAIDPGARTALVMPICNEDLGTVFGGLSATCRSLAATGQGDLFDVFILSDTPDRALRAAELQAWAELRRQLGDPPEGAAGRVFYRVRRQRRERKAGNVADFCRRWGRDYRYMIVLDADSTMDGRTLVNLVRTMEARPAAGIVQTLPQPVGHDTLHARAQQFVTRTCGELFALGMAYWQLGDSHYWGHNAILRVAPFMAHCRLAPLPGRGGLAGHILSHDFVEAAMMRRAGYEVWLLPQLGGSWEQAPATLLDELQRDRRWCQGNLMNARLLAEPGWRAAHRAMFGVGALSYLVAPLWLALLACTAFVSGGAAGQVASGAGAHLWLWALTLSLLLLPRGLGLLSVLLEGRAPAFGGGWRLAAGVALETLLSALLAPLRMIAHSLFVLGALTGLRLEWRSPPRQVEGVRWNDAWRHVGAPAALLLLAAIALATAQGLRVNAPVMAVWLALMLAVPLAVLGGSTSLGRRLRDLGIFLIPEELRPPLLLRRARASGRAFGALRPASAARASPATTARAPWRRAAFGSLVAAAVIATVIPHPAQTPSSDTDASETYRLAQLSRLSHLLLTADAGTARPAPNRLQSAPRRQTQRPARYIDDAVRDRARAAVMRSTARDLPPLPPAQETPENSPVEHAPWADAGTARAA